MNQSPRVFQLNPISNHIFMDMKNMQTCMNLNHLKLQCLLKWAQILQKHGDNMNYNNIMNMHVGNYELTTSKPKNDNMHATIKLQFNIMSHA